MKGLSQNLNQLRIQAELAKERTAQLVTVQGLCGAIVEFSVTGRVDLQVWQ
jgi:hypothetical protein